LVLRDKNIIEMQDISEVLVSPQKNRGTDVFQQSASGDPEKLLPLKDMEHRFRKEYFKLVRQNSNSDAEAARKLGLAPPNYYRMCKELGLK
jgi:hypothetical protein